jgi:hypothetical protein
VLYAGVLNHPSAGTMLRPPAAPTLP